MGKKGNDDMQVEASEEGVISDKGAVLSLKAVHTYTDEHVARGRAEYNNQKILVRSQHPLDQCLRRGIIEEEHHQIGKRLQSYRDCAVSKTKGRVYHAAGEGDSEMDAATIYANAMRSMNENTGRRNQWKLIGIVCFAEPDINGRYLKEADYSMLYRLASNIRCALEVADEALSQARKSLKDKLEKGRQPQSS